MKVKAPSTVRPPEKVVHASPIRLEIPEIKVDAAIAYAGLTPNGAMDIKKDPTEVAWYDQGPKPGENGSAVIAGHYGWDANGTGSVFDDLHTLKPGDFVSIEDDKTVLTSFVVRKVQLYNPNADATDVFNSNDGISHLNLITCDGIWNNATQTYSNRLVVFTDKVTR